MGLFMPNKRATYRKFSYEPRFWDPAKEEKIKRRIRLGRSTERKRPKGVIYFTVLLIIVLYLYLSFS